MGERFTPNGYRGPLIDKHSDKGGNWGVFNKTFENYLYDFKHVGRHHILELLQRLKNKTNPLVVDAMAPTDVLVDLKKNILRHPDIRGIAIGLQDTRPPMKKNQDKKEGISYMISDLRTNKDWKKLIKKVRPNSVDLFMERADGGLYSLPTRKLFFQAVMSRVWNLLNPDYGTALLQVPPADELERNGISFEKWVKRVQEAGIDCEYVPWYESGSDQGSSYGMLFLQKNPSAQNLPIPEEGELDAPSTLTEYPESILEKFERILQKTRELMKEDESHL